MTAGREPGHDDWIYVRDIAATPPHPARHFPLVKATFIQIIRPT